MNLEMKVGQLAKQVAERPSNSFGANMEKNPKEECKVMLTRSQKKVQEEEEAKEDQSGERRIDGEGEREEEKREEEGRRRDSLNS